MLLAFRNKLLAAQKMLTMRDTPERELMKDGHLVWVLRGEPVESLFAGLAGADDASSGSIDECTYIVWHLPLVLLSPYVPVFQTLRCNKLDEGEPWRPGEELAVEVCRTIHSRRSKTLRAHCNFVYRFQNKERRGSNIRCNRSSSSQGTGEYMVEYDAFATVELEDMHWYGKLYRLCSNPMIAVDELMVAKQHIRPLPLDEVEIWKPSKRGGGGGRGRGGRRGGRGRGRAGGAAVAGGVVLGLEDDCPFEGDGDGDCSGSERGSGSSMSIDGGSDHSAKLSDEDNDSVAADLSMLFGHDTEACVGYALANSKDIGGCCEFSRYEICSGGLRAGWPGDLKLSRTLQIHQDKHIEDLKFASGR